MAIDPSAAPAGRDSHLLWKLGPHWKGHLLLFEPEPLEPYRAASGGRLLLILVLVEGVLGPRMWLVQALGGAAPPVWFRVPLLLVLVLALLRWFARIRPSQLGLRGWSHWTRTERSYFIQVLVLANVIFASIQARQLGALRASSALWGSAVVALITSLLWGLYQELIYRGMLQTELTRRWGTALGILASNTVFTFGPLHFYHFAARTPTGAAAMLAGIFAIGLFFAVLFRRSANLWMLGIFHGLGNWYLVSLAGLTG